MAPMTPRLPALTMHFEWSEDVVYKQTIILDGEAVARLRAAGVDVGDPQAVFEHIDQENDPDLTLDGVEIDGGGKTYERGEIL